MAWALCPPSFDMLELCRRRVGSRCMGGGLTGFGKLDIRKRPLAVQHMSCLQHWDNRPLITASAILPFPVRGKEAKALRAGFPGGRNGGAEKKEKSIFHTRRGFYWLVASVKIG